MCVCVGGGGGGGVGVGWELRRKEDGKKHSFSTCTCCNLCDFHVPRSLTDTQDIQAINFADWNPYADPKFVFYDREMVNKCQSGDPVSSR